MGKRVIKGVERRYSVEYVMENYPADTRVKYNAPLGTPSKDAMKQYPQESLSFFRPWRKYTDAMVINPPYLDIIETKIWNPPSGFADLLEYRELIPETPELEEFSDLENRLFLVIPFTRPHWQSMGKRYEINMVVWRPDWLVPILKKRGLIS